MKFFILVLLVFLPLILNVGGIQMALYPEPGTYPLAYPDMYADVVMPIGASCEQAWIQFVMTPEVEYTLIHTNCIKDGLRYRAIPTLSLYGTTLITDVSVCVLLDEIHAKCRDFPGEWLFMPDVLVGHIR